MNEQDKQEITDLELARLVRELPREREPARDLWMGIERNILDHMQPQQVEKDGYWMPWAVAASLVIAVAALMLNLARTEQVYLGEVAGVERLEHDYVEVRNPMMEEFFTVNAALDDRTKDDLYRNLDILAQARKDLQVQARDNPDNRRLVEMLMNIHEQELELLKQDYTRPSRSM